MVEYNLKAAAKPWSGRSTRWRIPCRPPDDDVKIHAMPPRRAFSVAALLPKFFYTLFIQLLEEGGMKSRTGYVNIEGYAHVLPRSRERNGVPFFPLTERGIGITLVSSNTDGMGRRRREQFF